MNVGRLTVENEAGLRFRTLVREVEMCKILRHFDKGLLRTLRMDGVGKRYCGSSHGKAKDVPSDSLPVLKVESN